MERSTTGEASEPSSIRGYRQVYEGVALPVLVIDHESWRVLDVNEAALAQYGYDRTEFVGLPILEVRPPEGRAEARKVLSSMPHGFWRTTAVEHVRKDGSRFTADVWSRDTVVDGRDVRVATVSEVTDRVRLQRELQQAQKMEVVGQLVGGIAHDFNNNLAAILAASDLLRDQMDDIPEAVADLDEIQLAARRVASLTRQLLAFSRQQVMRVEVCSLSAVVRRAAALLEHVLDEGIEMELRTSPEAWTVRVDATQLEQVIMSLALNAQDAMPRGGRLVLATDNVSLSPGRAGDAPPLPPGDYAALTVQDTGTGMDEITQSRIFEPFFTTKPLSGGTGLGLSMSYGIVRQSGGFIDVESEPGQGTTFRILLPRADQAPLSPGESTGPGGSHEVLVVDDEDAVRRSTCRVLESLGCAVRSAGSAEEALAELEGDGRAVHLLVTDLSLPGMGGRELAERLRAADPELRVLFLSGYAVEPDGSGGGLDAGQGLLHKPFSVETLSAAVRRLLQEG